MPTWKKVVVSGSGLSQLTNDANYLTDTQTGAILTGSFSGSFQGDGSGLTGIASTLSFTGDTGNDTLNLKTESLTVDGASGIATSVTDNTITINAAGLSGSAHTQRLAIKAAGETYTDTAVDTLSGSVGSLLNPLDNRVDALEAFSSSLDAGFATEAEVASAVDALSGSAHIQRDALATSLASDISSEESARIAADTTLQSNIDSEESARIAADSALSSSIATTISNLSSTISISGSTGNSDVNLVTDDLSIVGVTGQTQTTVSGTTVSVGFVQNPTVPGNLTVTGDLTVTGNTFEAQVTNLNVEDRFILLNSGSNSGDTGIIFGGSDGTANVGSGIFWDSPANIFGFSQGIGSTDTSATHQSKLGNIEVSAGAPTGAPLFQGVGTIHVDTSTGDVLIYV